MQRLVAGMLVGASVIDIRSLRSDNGEASTSTCIYGFLYLPSLEQGPDRDLHQVASAAAAAAAS